VRLVPGPHVIAKAFEALATERCDSAPAHARECRPGGHISRKTADIFPLLSDITEAEIAEYASEVRQQYNTVATPFR
jgi:hypothetical protein